MRAAKDIKSFWKKFKHLLSNSLVKETILFIKNRRIIKDGKEISPYSNEYFATITDFMSIPNFPTPPDTAY